MQFLFTLPTLKNWDTLASFSSVSSVSRRLEPWLQTALSRKPYSLANRGRGEHLSLSRVVPPWPSPDWPGLSGVTTACSPAKGWRLRTGEALWLVHPVLNPPWCDGQRPCSRKRGFHSDVAPGESFLIGKISYFVSVINSFTQKSKVVILYLGVHFKILI